MVTTLYVQFVHFSLFYPLSLNSSLLFPSAVFAGCCRCMSEASTIEGVLELRNAHFWQLDFSSMVGTVDVRVRRDADEQMVLTYVTEKLSSVVSMLTVQVYRFLTSM